MTQVNIPTFKLNNGLQIPALGYGTWLGMNDKMEFIIADIDKFVDSLSYAIDVGYRHIDTAHLYRVEPEVGAVVNEKIKKGVVKREELFITTKVWQHDHRAEDVEKSVRASLKRMKLDYLDLVLIHWPMSISEDCLDEKIDYLETWRGFESVLAKGLVKSIGVSNFNKEQMKRLLANCKVKPVCNQLEVNLNLGCNDIVDFCKQENVLIVAYSPFGSLVPSRTGANTPEPRIDNPKMVTIAKKYNKSVPQVVLRYLYQRGIVSIPKTITKSRIVENADIFNFQLDATDMSTIAAFDIGYRTVRPTWWQDFENYPFEKVEGPKLSIPQALVTWKNGANLDID